MGLIFALDYDNHAEALNAVDKLRGVVDMFKVGLELFLVGGFPLVDAIEAPVFLDLKLHDIPETVKRAVKVAVKHRNVELLSVHASGGREMLEAAFDMGDNKIAAVTLLTSLNENTAGEVGYIPTCRYFADRGHIEVPVLEMIDVAWDSGVRNIICSPKVVGALKDLYPNDMSFIVPGIRINDKKDDHAAPATPARAVADGATHLVVGRPIRDSKDPVYTALAIKTEMGFAAEMGAAS